MGRIYLPGRSKEMDGLIYREADNASTVLLIHSNDSEGVQTFVDSKNSREITAWGGAKHTTAQRKFGASSIYFDGNDYIYLADNADWDAGTGTLTFDFWIRFDDVAADQGILSHYSAVDLCWGLKWNHSTSQLFFRNINGASFDDEIEFSWSPSANIWYHVALIRGWDSNVNQWAGCVNGTALDSGELGSINMAPTNTGNLKIGFYTVDEVPDVFDHCYLRGYIDEFRMIKGAAAWTANFTPPKGMYL